MTERGTPVPGSVVASLAPVALLWIAVLALHLTPVLFAALIVYAGTRGIAAALLWRWPRLRHAHGWALAMLATAAALAGALALERAAELAPADLGYGALMHQMAVALEQLRTAAPAWLQPHVPASLETLREAAAGWLRNHAAQVQLWGGHTLRGIGYALAGAVIGSLLALQLAPLREQIPGTRPLERSLRHGFDNLVATFSAVVFAQLRIAAVNTALTALYLMVILPALGSRLPMSGTLVVATFVASLVPVLGNLVSNTMIVVVSLTQSGTIAALSLAWLVLIHKLEYFLNAHIVGNRIRARAWEVLVAMLVLEAIFGLPGLVSAPVIYAQAKSALAARGLL